MWVKGGFTKNVYYKIRYSQGGTTAFNTGNGSIPYAVSEMSFKK